MLNRYCGAVAVPNPTAGDPGRDIISDHTHPARNTSLSDDHETEGRGSHQVYVKQRTPLFNKNGNYNIIIIVLHNKVKHNITRRLSCRKDDRAMCPMYGCPEKFRESLTMPMATFPEIFNGLLFRSSL